MPGWLTDAEIAAMQSTILNGVLPDTCDIIGNTYISDGAGGQNIGTAIVSGGSAVPCRKDDLASSPTGQREVIAGAEGVMYPYVFTLQVDAPIADDRMISHGGHIYQIRQINDDPSWLLCRRAYCERINDGLS